MKMTNKYGLAGLPITPDFMSEWKPKKKYPWIAKNLAGDPLNLLNTLKLMAGILFVSFAAHATGNVLFGVCATLCYYGFITILSQQRLEIDDEGLTRERFAAKKWKELFAANGAVYVNNNIHIDPPFTGKEGYGRIYFGKILDGGWRYVRDEKVVFDRETIRDVHSLERATFQLILCGQVFLEATLITEGNVDYRTMVLIESTRNEGFSLLQTAEGFCEIVSEDTVTAAAIKDLLAKLAPAIMYVCEGEIPANPADEASLLKWLLSKERTAGTPYEVTYKTGWKNGDIPTVAAAA